MKVRFSIAGGICLMRKVPCSLWTKVSNHFLSTLQTKQFAIMACCLCHVIDMNKVVVFINAITILYFLHHSNAESLDNNSIHKDTNIGSNSQGNEPISEIINHLLHHHALLYYLFYQPKLMKHSISNVQLEIWIK